MTFAQWLASRHIDCQTLTTHTAQADDLRAEGERRRDAVADMLGVSVLTLATEYRDAGISVHPLRLDGTKAPALSSWQPYTQRLATDEELSRWFRKPAGIGMICGAISGGLEVIDFDDGSLFSPWQRMVPHIVERLPVVETPSGGWHVLFRCDEIGGNCKIAMDPAREKQTLIETRGEGGYIAAEGSPCETHATGLPYVQYSGPHLPTIPTITPDERRELWRAARTFDQRGEEFRKKLAERHARQTQPRSQQDVHPVVAAWCERHSWADLLTSTGWTSRDGEHWTRPGKRYGTSARLVLSSDGVELLTVFSANCGSLSPTGSYRTWNLFNAWAAIEHGGDNRAAFMAAGNEVLV